MLAFKTEMIKQFRQNRLEREPKFKTKFLLWCHALADVREGFGAGGPEEVQDNLGGQIETDASGEELH